MSAIVEAVERLAIARGWLSARGREYDKDNLPPWVVHFPPAPMTHVSIGNFEGIGVRVDPRTALLWSLLVGLDVEPVDVGECPACVKRGGGWIWMVHRSIGFKYDGWRRRVVESYGSGDAFLETNHCCRPCPDCSVIDDDPRSPTFGDDKPTGRDLRHPARLLLDASPQPYTDDERMIFGTDPRPASPLGGCGDLVSSTHRPGDTEARDRLAVLADLWDGGRATHAVEVAIAAKWVPHDLGPSRIVVRNDGRVGSIRTKPGHAPLPHDVVTGECETLIAEATTRIEARPLRTQARWLVSWVLGWPGDSSEVCGAEMTEAAAKIWKRLTVPCRRCPGFHYSDRGGVHVIHCPHCGDHGRAPGGADSDRRDQLTTNGVTVVAEWGSPRAEALTRAQSAHEPVTISGLEYVVTRHSVDHTADPSSRGRVTFDLTRLRRVTTSATDTSVEVADVDLLPAMTDGGHETPPPE